MDTTLTLNGIDHYAVNVLDLQKSADWYAHVLGFTVLHRWETTWMVGRGNIRVGLFLRPQATPLEDPETRLVIKHVAFAVDGDKFLAAHEHLRARKVELSGPEDTGIAYSTFFNDVDGNLLELTTYHSATPVIPAA